MSVEFKLPELGENVESGDVVKVLVSVGDVIAEDQPVLEVETGKAVVEVPSSVRGKVVAIHVSEGDKAEVGQPILTVESVGEAQAVPPATPLEAVAGREAAAAIEARMEADVSAGVTPEDVAPPRPPEPPKAPAAAPAPEAPAPEAPQVMPEAERRGPVIAAPSVRQFAREIGVDVYDVAGSGPGGRISIEDVKKHARQALAATVDEARARPSEAALARVAPPPLPDFSSFGEVERQSMSSVRVATMEHLSLSWTAIPHVTQFDTADATELEGLRKRYQERAERAGGKLTITAILLKIAAAALRRFPQFNASVDAARREVVYKKYLNVGVAVDTDRGLIVPVIRNVDRKNVFELAAELGDAAARARDRKIRPDDLQGGNFTISNLGGLGGKHFAPVVNYPEVAILGVGRATLQPTYVAGELQPRLMLPLALSYDHRLIDGADGTRFLRWIVEAIEQPFLLSLEG